MCWPTSGSGELGDLDQCGLILAIEAQGVQLGGDGGGCLRSITSLARADDVDRPLHHVLARLHQVHEHPEAILVAAPKVPAEPLAADGHHLCTHLFSRDLGDRLHVVANDPGTTA